ncbi:MAG: molybdopterin-guanine dinucleotide biosynthesis protein B [Asgard group archaeon]|nr:molybdopterin-guanine dinucleotide biosynthesis protein B [Asgard group archaeon]
MKLFAIVGITDSGKTTTLIEIIKELTKRKKIINTVKAIHIDNFSLDIEGKDSWLHKQAGAKATAIRSNIETTFMYQRSMEAKEIIEFFKGDYLIFEGFHKEGRLPKIVCGKTIEDIELRIDDSTFVISGCITNSIKEYKGLPAINGLKEIDRLADLIEQKALDSSLF